MKTHSPMETYLERAIFEDEGGSIEHCVSVFQSYVIVCLALCYWIVRNA